MQLHWKHNESVLMAMGRIQTIFIANISTVEKYDKNIMFK